MALTNRTDLSLPLAALLAFDDYDYVKTPNYVSATGLLNSTKSLILKSRLPTAQDIDLIDLLPSVLGTALHDRLEKAMLPANYVKSLHRLGIPGHIIDRVKINPTEVVENDIPIYLEQRSVKELNGFNIGGKYDVVYQNTVRDLKSCKTFKWIKGDFEDYIKQGSIYRWLNQDIITEDHMFIDFIFTDWKKFEAEGNPNYPQQPVLSKRFNLMTIPETENWISDKLSEVTRYKDADQASIPRCTLKELWQEPSKYAYYKKLGAKRATKVFTELGDAVALQQANGGVGLVETREGKPRKCDYCSAKAICKQAQDYIFDGLLEA